MDELVMSDVGAVAVKYCQEHYDELHMALVQRQLADQICETQEQLIELLVNGEMDPLLESSNAITSAAIQMFGPHAILDSGGCPICCFRNVITHVADHMAVKYRESN
jgi:hypothetical protein